MPPLTPFLYVSALALVEASPLAAGIAATAGLIVHVLAATPDD